MKPLEGRTIRLLVYSRNISKDKNGVTLDGPDPKNVMSANQPKQ